MEVSKGCNAVFFGDDPENFTYLDHEKPVFYKVLEFDKDKDIILVANDENELVYVSASDFEDVMVEEIECIIDKSMTQEDFDKDLMDARVRLARG